MIIKIIGENGKHETATHAGQWRTYTEKNDYKREMALALQEIEFKNRKIADLGRSLHDFWREVQRGFEKSEWRKPQELSATIEKLTLDKESLEQKLEQKKKNLKEMATSSARQIGALEKENAVLASQGEIQRYGRAVQARYREP